MLILWCPGFCAGVQQLTFYSFEDPVGGMRNIPSIDRPHANQRQLPGKAVFSLNEDRTAVLCQEKLADGSLGELITVGDHMVYEV